LHLSGERRQIDLAGAFRHGDLIDLDPEGRRKKPIKRRGEVWIERHGSILHHS
jgi:hypothetical protein